MATFPQRFVSICDAIFNATSTPAQQAAVLQAWCPHLPPDLTQAQKAQAGVQAIVRHTRQLYKSQLPDIDAAIAAAEVKANTDIPDA